MEKNNHDMNYIHVGMYIRKVTYPYEIQYIYLHILIN